MNPCKGTRGWRDFTAPNITSGSLDNGFFKCYACADFKEKCKSDLAKHQGKYFKVESGRPDFIKLEYGRSY